MHFGKSKMFMIY